MSTKNGFKLKLPIIIRLALLLLLIPINHNASATTDYVQGIYLHEVTMHRPQYLQYLIEKAKETGINTFVIDLKDGNKEYQNNIKLVHAAGIKYVARIVVFPEGGTDAEITSEAVWQQRYQLVEKALQLGAKEIQLDYIRYNTSQLPSPQNAENVNKVIKWFKNKLIQQNIPLQIDVFGISSFGNSLHIGQNLLLFANNVDAICPMVYPSHYEPYLKYAHLPYLAVRLQLKALHQQFPNSHAFKIYPFIELYNYRHAMSDAEKIKYISDQLTAITDSQTDGWYAWNIHNNYDNLFLVLKNKKTQQLSAIRELHDTSHS